MGAGRTIFDDDNALHVILSDQLANVLEQSSWYMVHIDIAYRIARHFRGLNFSRFSRINDEPRKFYPPKFYHDFTYVRLNIRRARERNPRKLNREKFWEGSSAKILVLENFWLKPSLVPRPFPVFSMLHAEKREGLVDFVM